MPLGDLKPWSPRRVSRLLFDNDWRDIENLLEMTCTCAAESGLYPHAWHWNDPADGGNGSTDWGMFQLNDGNIGGSKPDVDSNGKPIPDAKVADFAAIALDPEQAVLKARSLYKARGFQPWYGHTQPDGSEPWKNYIPEVTRGMCNMLRELHGLTTFL
jgi:hypothetical protein